MSRGGSRHRGGRHERGPGHDASLDGRGLSDPMAWHGVFATTWPSGGDWINLPLMQLDHLWVGAVEVGDERTIRLPGSDHQGILFRIR